MNLTDPDYLRKLEIISKLMLCTAALTFPFSVAATNITLGTAVFFGLVSGLIWKGLRTLWIDCPSLALALLAYTTLMFTGLLWSLDLPWGLHILSRQWFWLLLPLTVVTFRDESWSRRFLLFLSISLTLHLLFCVFQIFGWVEVTTSGSGANDPTGHIGHISFGFVYGIWAAWLFHIGWNRSGLQRWSPWLLALWAIIMTFMAQGRSGYLIILVLSLAFIWKLLSSGYRLRFRHALIALGLLAVIGTVLITGPAKDRLIGTLYPPGLANAIDFKHDTRPRSLTFSMASTQMHLSLWYGALAVWKEHPSLGVGTGGFPLATMQILQKHPELNYGSRSPRTHPHNGYLLALTRWGPLGLIAFIWLLYNWIKLGWKTDWLEKEQGMLISLTGIALLVHGLTASSMEEHFSALLAIMLLGLGIAGLHRDRLKSPSS